ncbi:MAG: hypothetical protein ACK4QW_08050 [Alphaproteobacteria bacterium]
MKIAILPALAVSAGLVAATGLVPPAAAVEGARTKSQIIACAGQPDRALMRGDVEYLYYSAPVRTEILPYGSAELARKERCEYVVVLVDGRSYTGKHETSFDLLRGQMCAPRVMQCVD